MRIFLIFKGKCFSSPRSYHFKYRRVNILKRRDKPLKISFERDYFKYWDKNPAEITAYFEVLIIKMYRPIFFFLSSFSFAAAMYF